MLIGRKGSRVVAARLRDRHAVVVEQVRPAVEAAVLARPVDAEQVVDGRREVVGAMRRADGALAVAVGLADDAAHGHAGARATESDRGADTIGSRDWASADESRSSRRQLTAGPETPVPAAGPIGADTTNHCEKITCVFLGVPVRETPGSFGSSRKVANRAPAILRLRCFNPDASGFP